MTITEKITALVAMSDEAPKTPITVTITRTHAEEGAAANTATTWDYTELLEIATALGKATT